MWLCLLIASATLSIASAQENASSSSGPRSQQEAQVLWKEGKESFEAKRFEDAARAFQRFVDRYPAQEETLEARHWLAKSRMALGQNDKAIAPLKAYVAALGKSEEATLGRLELGRAYLELGKFREAQLTAMETLRQKGQSSPSPAIRNLARLQQVEALLGMKKDRDAQALLQSVDQELKKGDFKKPTEGPVLAAQLTRLKILSKNRDCEKLPSRGKLDESQTAHQMQRRGTCQLEAFVQFRDLLETRQSEWIQRTSSEMQRSLRDYAATCVNPPAPRGKRSPTQLKRYQAELASLLMPECRKTFQNSLEFLSTWQAEWKDQPSAPNLAELQATRTQVEQIASTLRIPPT